MEKAIYIRHQRVINIVRKVADVKINIPKYPRHILNTLHNAGYEAYIVGGCVRDSVLGKIPSDFDITTNAKPDVIRSLFRKTIDTGIKHGTITVLFYENNKPFTYEVTTFRSDGDYEDFRHPKNVTFVSDLKEDLLRRDFTINAMAYSEETGLIDIFGGLIDLDKKTVRAVGKPIDRFTEDALRLLRAIRFAAKLGFSIEEETKNAIPKLAKNLAHISKERVQVELTKILTSDNPEYVKLIYDYGLATYVSKGFEKIKIGKFVKNSTLYTLYAGLFYNCDVDFAYNIMRELKLDNNTITKVSYLLSARQYYGVIDELYKTRKYVDFKIAIKELINILGYDLTFDFISIIEANKGQNVCLKKVYNYVIEFKDNKEPIYISDLDINGNDLMQIGYNGQEIGTALASLLKIVHQRPKLNQKKILQDISKEVYNRYKGGNI